MVADPVRDLDADVERLDLRADRRVVGQRLQRLRRELLRARQVGLRVERDLGERRERGRLELLAPLLHREDTHLLHLGGDRVHVAEPLRRACRVPAPLDVRLELDRAQEELARGRERLARHRAATRGLERLGSLDGEVRRSRAVELGEQIRGAVEVERADLEQLLPRSLLQPGREPRVLRCAR